MISAQLPSHPSGGRDRPVQRDLMSRFVQNVRGVHADGLLADHQLRSDFGVGSPGHQVAEYLPLGVQCDG
jgi:hypothetical protein